jgi:hypothetical protein
MQAVPSDPLHGEPVSRASFVLLQLDYADIVARLLLDHHRYHGPI